MKMAPSTATYFYPRPPRGGRPYFLSVKGAIQHISIHALREEGDLCFPVRPLKILRFLSTPSARRATWPADACICGDCRFLSTPSARRATCAKKATPTMSSYFYPRPPRGGRRSALRSGYLPRSISIHALREEGDPPCADIRSESG